MIRRLLAVLVGALAMTAPASADTQAIQVDNHAGVRPAVLNRIERGLLIQLNHQVKPWWHTPTVAFGPSNWRIRIVRPSVMRRLQGDVGGFHQTDSTGPYAVVSSAGGTDGVSSAMSHELIEMLVNPRGDRILGNYLAEVCDPVANATYFVWDGETPVFVQDFVTPLWFSASSRGRWDQTQAAAYAGDYRFGSAYRLDPATQEFVYLIS